jgi:GH24 family phage-related lysozyme (muramidase)
MSIDLIYIGRLQAGKAVCNLFIAREEELLRVSRREAIGFLAAVGLPRGAQAAGFDELLQVASGDEAVAAASRLFSEKIFNQTGPSAQEVRGNPALPRRWTSDKVISQTGIDLIIACEVTSKAVYDRKYGKPTWPGGKSGVTIGIGYDLGYQNTENISEDWAEIIVEEGLNRLGQASLVTGSAAEQLAVQLGDQRITWDQASTNFKRIIKFYGGETARYFPNCDELSPDSFGALVSIVYNRGSASKVKGQDRNDSRREIRNIKSYCLQEQFGMIPAEIRSMKRLWVDNNSAKGLVVRRELEALLFEKGLHS